MANWPPPLDTHTGRAVRVMALEEARERAPAYAPHVTGGRHAVQTAAYTIMPDEELVAIQEVRLVVPEEDMPGPPVSRVRCDRCGEGINDRRKVRNNGHILCHQNGCSQKLMVCHQNGCSQKLMVCHQNGCSQKLMVCHQNGCSQKLMAIRYARRAAREWCTLLPLA